MGVPGTLRALADVSPRRYPSKSGETFGGLQVEENPQSYLCFRKTTLGWDVRCTMGAGSFVRARWRNQAQDRAWARAVGIEGN